MEKVFKGLYFIKTLHNLLEDTSKLANLLFFSLLELVVLQKYTQKFICHAYWNVAEILSEFKVEGSLSNQMDSVNALHNYFSLLLIDCMKQIHSDIPAF